MTPTQNATTSLVSESLISEPSADTYPSNSGSHSTAINPPAPILPAATKTEKFLLTAADQESGSRDERLNSVIQSKYEAGLLKPYNYVKGYARLSRWMDRKLGFVFIFRLTPDPSYSYILSISATACLKNRNNKSCNHYLCYDQNLG